MKVVVIGCTHAGTATVVNLKKEYPECDVTIYEKNDNVSFLSCGIALNVGQVVKDTKDLFYNSPENLRKLGVVTNLRHEVTNIDFNNKEIVAENLLTGEIITDSYDKLVLTLGSWPIVPRFEGGDLENILLCKNHDHALEIIKKAKEYNKVVVIGAGYIGVELVEAFKMLGKEVTLIDGEDRIMPKYLDKEFTEIAEKEFTDRGVKMALSQKVEKFTGENGKVKSVVTEKGEYEAELVILCIGFAPSTKLVKDKLNTLPNGAIIIDEYMRTSRENVFAAGDCCMVRYNPAKDNRYIPLATNAVRMGTLVAKNIVEPTIKYMGTQGTSGIKIFDKRIASTGLTESVAKTVEGIEVGTSTIVESFRPEFMPTHEEVTLKLVYDKKTMRVLGGQIVSNIDITQIMNTLSVVIQNDMTVMELAMTDFFFQPHFNKPWNLLNSVALQAL